MTDREKLKELLDSFGVGYREVVYCNEAGDKVIATDIVCEEGANKVGGHFAFYTTFEFGSKGEFILMGAWE